MQTLKQAPIISLIDEIDQYDDEDIIYVHVGKVSQLTPETFSSLMYFTDEEEVLLTTDNRTYLLEVYLVKEVLQVWREWRKGRAPTLNEKYEAIKYYAENDAYVPVE